jgi:polysaccharide export outer membrane protein
MRMLTSTSVRAIALTCGIYWSAALPSAAQQTAAPSPSTPPSPAGVATTPATDPNVPPSDYVIGPDDILSVAFWRDKDLSTDVVVRPDGKISLQVLNDIQAAGLTPEALRDRIREVASKYFEEPAVTVIVKQINSRKVYVMGEVNKPGPFALTSPTTVIQLLAQAGGLNEYAKKSDVTVIRTENGQQKRFRVNYEDILKGKNLQQNIELKVGDTIIVP